MVDALNEQLIRKSICDLTFAERTQQGFEVSLPQVYHNGQVVTVIVAKAGDCYEVHDNSYAAMLLSANGISVGRKLANVVAPQIAAYGCRLEQLRVRTSCLSIDQIGVAMTQVGCASRLIADQLLKADRAPVRDFKSSVISEILNAVGEKRVRTDEEISGHLGSRYKVSAVVLDKSASRPLAFVEPVSDREGIARRFKEFYDLSRTPQYEDVQRVAIYDENQAISSGDALLMEEVGNFVRYIDAPARFRSWMTVQ